MKTLTLEIIEAINKLNELVSKAEQDAEVKSELATVKVDKPYNSKNRKVSVKGAVKSVAEHVKAISKVEEPAVDEVKAEPVVAEQKIAIVVEYEPERRGKNGYGKRYAVIDKFTGEVLNDAQKYGFKTESDAYRFYKNNDRGYKVELSDNGKEEVKSYFRKKYYQREYGKDPYYG